MAATGYSDLKEFQRIDVVVAPYGSTPNPALTFDHAPNTTI